MRDCLGFRSGAPGTREVLRDDGGEHRADAARDNDLWGKLIVSAQNGWVVVF